jgi:hypothetical protein
MSRLPMSIEQYHEEIDRRLNEIRPARYHEDDRDWMAPVVQWAEDNIPPELRARALDDDRPKP